MSASVLYTTQLQAGLGLVEETKLLLALYEPGMSAPALYTTALGSGLFPMVSARRLLNIVAEAFAPRYIRSGAAPCLKAVAPHLPGPALTQLFLLYTAEANPILRDFLQEVYWDRYIGGHVTLAREDATDFVVRAVREGKTRTAWSESTIERVSSYLLGCCADYGLLGSGRGAQIPIHPARIDQWSAFYWAYKLYFDGLGDNAAIAHPSWGVFGLHPSDVREEFKRLVKNGWMIVQSVGDVTRISWQFSSMEGVVGVIAQC